MTDIGMVKYAFETEYDDVVDETAKEELKIVVKSAIIIDTIEGSR